VVKGGKKEEDFNNLAVPRGVFDGDKRVPRKEPAIRAHLGQTQDMVGDPSLFTTCRESRLRGRLALFLAQLVNHAAFRSNRSAAMTKLSSAFCARRRVSHVVVNIRRGPSGYPRRAT